MSIYYNDKLIDEPFISPFVQGFQYGLGVFETVLVHSGSPMFLELHHQRLLKGCAKLGLKPDCTLEELRSRALRLIDHLDIEEGRLKLVCFRDLEQDSTMITLTPYKSPEEPWERGITIGISSIKRNPYSPLTYIKSLNYADNILARAEVNAHGYGEALFLNAYNKLCEGAMSNIFWVKESMVYTPDISCGILEGITRGQILALCADLGIKLEEGSYDLTELLEAEEVFVTNSLMGLVPVHKVDNIVYNLSNYRLTKSLYNEYQRLLSREAGK